MLVSLKGIFSPQAVIQTLKTMPILKTTVMDLYFTSRPTHPFPMIGLSELVDVVQTVPMVRRDGVPISLEGETMTMQYIAPLPVKVKIPVTASELNDLKLIMPDAAAVEAWRARKLEKIRRTVRDTTEAMCAVVLTTGRLTWPVELPGGRTETYEVDYGAPLEYTPAAKLTAASKVRDVYFLLCDIEDRFRHAGQGGDIEFLAGKDVFAVLLDIAEAYVSTTDSKPYRVALEQGVITIAGYTIRKMTESYPDPLDSGGDWLPKLSPKLLLGVAKAQQGQVWYCAIDSISANNRATPLHITPIASDDDSSIMLIGNTKPLPARASRAVCRAVVVD